MQNELIFIEGEGGGELALSRDAAQFIERFLSEADVAPTTKDAYRRALRQFFLWYAERGGGDLTRADILAYKQAQLGKVQAATVGAYLTAVKSFFKWLEAEKLYPNVAAGVKGVRLSRGHRKDALTPAQVRHVLGTLKGDTLRAKRDFALFNLLVRVGLRFIMLMLRVIECSFAQCNHGSTFPETHSGSGAGNRTVQPRLGCTRGDGLGSCRPVKRGRSLAEERLGWSATGTTSLAQEPPPCYV